MSNLEPNQQIRLGSSHVFFFKGWGVWYFSPIQVLTKRGQLVAYQIKVLKSGLVAPTGACRNCLRQLYCKLKGRGIGYSFQLAITAPLYSIIGYCIATAQSCLNSYCNGQQYVCAAQLVLKSPQTAGPDVWSQHMALGRIYNTPCFAWPFCK